MIMGDFTFKFLKAPLLVLVLGVLLNVSYSTQPLAQTCTIPGAALFPSAPNWVSQFGDRRGTGQRKHTGLDLGYDVNHQVPHPVGCEILLNPDGGYRWNNQNLSIDDGDGNILRSEGGGYGYQLFYRCGAPDGDQITLRYAHLPKDPITPSRQIIQGCSGSSGCGYESHYHFEIVIGDRPVDPECVMYGKKPEHFSNLDAPSPGCNQACPAGIGPGPANLCDANTRDILINHGVSCSTAPNHPNGQTRAVPNGKSIDPNRIAGNGEIDPNAETGEPPSEGHTHDDSQDGTDETVINTDGFTGNPDDFYPPSAPLPPPIPLPAPVPGTPGGDPNLVPAPEEGEAPKKLSGCAADTWTAMVNQAVMQSRREDLLNKRFIVKPDSVLDYSCFSQKVKAVADYAGVFSETDLGAQIPVDVIGDQVIVSLGTKEADNEPFYSEKDFKLTREYEQSNGATLTYERFDNTSLDMAIDSLVGKAAAGYFNESFVQGYLADTTPVSGANPETCNIMSAVWQAAKCKNFDDANVFYTFEDLINRDPRDFPVSMPCF